MSRLKNMHYFSREIGELIKSTKKEFNWGFTLEDRDISIQYFVSKFGSKRRIVYNQKVIRTEECLKNNYSFEFIMDGHNYKIIHTVDLVDLLVDGESFGHSYNLEISKREFNEGQDPNINNIVADIDHNVEHANIKGINEIVFIKQEQPKQILNFSIGNNIKENKESNLKNFQFSYGENNFNKNDIVRFNNVLID